MNTEDRTAPLRKGFNYGAPLPLPSPDTSDGKLFADATDLADRLGGFAMEASRRHWRLTMALRTLRLACTEREAKVATDNLRTAYADLYRFSPDHQPNGDPSPNPTFADFASIGKQDQWVTWTGYGDIPEKRAPCEVSRRR